MVRSRQARVVVQEEHDDTDTGGDTEPDTPIPSQRQRSKRRISERFETDGSFGADGGGRAPLRSMNINDDTAEKRRRRKSTKLTVIENAEAGPSTERQEHSSEPSKTPQAKQRPLNSVLPPPVINVPLDVMNSNFEEWMKMATDNKINATNSWNFALIDYFHDMSLLRNNIDNSINFQRASCTLDGCVKIWTSRVDSVGTETGKLLSNLANESAVAEDDEGATSDNPDPQDPSQARRKKKAHRPDSTLAKDASQLRSKKLDLEFSVDPLFRKTCADFDEGGAHGLLMNHLSLGVGSEANMRVVFDASDSMGRVMEEEEQELEPEDKVDLSHLRSEFLPDLNTLEEMEIAHSLADFSFSQSNLTFDDTTLYRDDTRVGGDDDDGNDAGFDVFGAGDTAMDVDGGGPPQTEDFFQGDQAVDDDFYAGGDDGDYGRAESGSVATEGEQGQGQATRSGPFVPFDPRRVPTERDLVVAMTDADGQSDVLGYFDQNVMKNWAGPEHWKVRKVIRKPEPAAEGAAPKSKREKKEAFKIDFLIPPEKDVKTMAKELFTPVTRGHGITLPHYSALKSAGKKSNRSKRMKEEKRNEHTLPDDMHFSSRQLVTLFLKPKFSLKMRGQRVRFNETGDGEVDENFWAQAAADQAAGLLAQDGDESGEAPAPFNTQFFNDDDDAPAFDDIYDGDGSMPDDAGEQDLLAATQGMSRRVRPEFVNYARRAKRVDVRKLKENIWKGLDIKVAQKNEEDEEDEMDVDHPQLTDPSEARDFSSVISGLQRSYPKDKMEDISTSFCFICLLHLANEQGLKLQSTGGPGKDDQEENQETTSPSQLSDRVGDIWCLKVSRDPNATPAA